MLKENCLSPKPFRKCQRGRQEITDYGIEIFLRDQLLDFFAGNSVGKFPDGKRNAGGKTVQIMKQTSKRAGVGSRGPNWARALELFVELDFVTQIFFATIGRDQNQLMMLLQVPEDIVRPDLAAGIDGQ